MIPLELDHLGKRFGETVALHELSLQLPAGAFVVLLGPSGCGKTTTLRMLAGLEDPTAGQIRFGERVVADGERGVTVPAEQRGLGMVFQSYALWPHMRVRANVEWPLRVAGWDRAERARRVAEVLTALDIEALADRHPAELSGGQQQRVAIARTIAPRPEVLLFDEPLSNLDARLRVETRAELVRVHRASGATSVYVTHDQVEALAMATHIAVLDRGRLEQFGTPTELLERPATSFVASFLGTPPAVLLTGENQGRRLVRDGVELAELPDETPGWRAMYRAQDLSLAGSGPLAIEVVESTPMAGRHLVTGLVGADRVSIVTDAAAVPGTRTGLVLPGSPTALFDRAGRRA